MKPPRRWQARALDRFLDEWHLDPFLCQVPPGAGKTYFSGLCAAEFPQTVILVSNVNTISGFDAVYGKSLAVLGNHAIPADATAVLSTYQRLTRDKGYLRRFMERDTTLLVCDEAHHLGENKAWGNVVRTLPAARRLLLTATPMRSDRAMLPWPSLYTPDGDIERHVELTYEDGREQGFLRDLEFLMFDATVEWVDHKARTRHAADFQAPLSKAGARKRLRHFLDMPELHLELLRRGVNGMYPGDAMLVIARDQHHARRLHELMPDAGLAISQRGRAARAAVEAFRKGKVGVLITVAMVAEGVDVPHCNTLVLLTNKVTQTHFHQAVGRVMRGTGRARVLHMADPRFIELAKQFHVPPPRLVRPRKPRTGGPSGPGTITEALRGRLHEQLTRLQVVSHETAIEPVQPRVATHAREALRHRCREVWHQWCEHFTQFEGAQIGMRNRHYNQQAGMTDGIKSATVPQMERFIALVEGSIRLNRP